MKPYKACSCRDAVGMLLGKRCPQLMVTYVDKRTGETKHRWSPTHGRWYVRYEAPRSAEGRRQQPRLGPFATEKEARDALVTTLSSARMFGHVTDRRTTVAEHLDRMLSHWQTERKPSTYASAKEAITLYWRPSLGHLRLADLTEEDVRQAHVAMRQINKDDAQPSEMLRRLLGARAARDGKRTSSRPLSEARIKRMNAVLVTALNAKSARKVLPVNPAASIDFRTGRTKPLLWTAERVERYAETGRKPGPVMVWTQVQAGRFLDAVADDRLYPLWHVAVYWGLRRGELVGLDWSDVRLDARRVAVRQSQPDTQTENPKSEAGDRVITVDAETARVLRAWRRTQLSERVAWGAGWTDTGRVFTREDGSALRPEHVSDRFRRLVGAAGLPPARFHDLRHGSATMLLAAGVPMKVVSEILGHASSAFTADVYTSVSEDLAEAAADAIAAFIPRKTHARGDA